MECTVDAIRPAADTIGSPLSAQGALVAATEAVSSTATGGTSTIPKLGVGQKNGSCVSSIAVGLATVVFESES